jgi:hypothetical protein
MTVSRHHAAMFMSHLSKNEMNWLSHVNSGIQYFIGQALQLRCLVSGDNLATFHACIWTCPLWACFLRQKDIGAVWPCQLCLLMPFLRKNGDNRPERLTYERLQKWACDVKAANENLALELPDETELARFRALILHRQFQR